MCCCVTAQHFGLFAMVIYNGHAQDDGDVRLARMRRAAGYEDDGTFNPALLDVDALLGGPGEQGPEEGAEEGAWLRAFKRRKALADLAVCGSVVCDIHKHEDIMGALEQLCGLVYDRRPAPQAPCIPCCVFMPCCVAHPDTTWARTSLARR